MRFWYLFAASMMAVSLSAGPTYDVITFQVPLPMEPLNGINNVGQAVGVRYQSGYFILTTTGVETHIPSVPGWSYNQTTRINDSGQITGTGAPNGQLEPGQAFIGSTSGSAAIPLSTGWLGSLGRAINRSGQVTGYGLDANHQSHAFIGSPTGISVIPLPNGFTLSDASDINDAGQVSGTACISLGVCRAYIGTSAGVTLIPLPTGWTDSEGAAINNAGQVAGYGITAANLSQAFIGTAASATPLPLPPGCNSAIANWLNDLGQVLGFCGPGNVLWIWDSVNGPRLLQDLVPSGWSVEAVEDLNDVGQILAWGHFTGVADGQFFLLNPASGPLIITSPASLTSATVGIAYGPVQLLPGHGSGGYTWSATGLPNGLMLSSTGRLSGTPAAGSQGVYSPQFTVRDSSNAIVSITRTLTVTTPAPLVITGPTSLSPQKEGNGFLVQFTATGGTGAYVWSATGLPAGLTMSPSGLFSGGPASGTHGTYNLQFTVRDSSNVTASVTLSLTIYPPIIITGPTTLPGGTVGGSYGPIQFTATGGTGNHRWGLVYQPLPAGLSLSAAGVLSGTPAPGTTGVYTLTFGVEDLLPSMSISAAVTLSLTVVQSTQPAPVISSVSPNPFPALNGNQLLTINGTGFQNGSGFRAHVGANDVNGDFTGSQVNFLSSTQVTILINLGTTATNRTVQVFNPDGKSSNVFVFPVVSQPVSISLALPQIAFGGGWYTALYFSNTNTTAATVRVDFIGENGNPLSVPLIGIGSVASRSVSLSPGATTILEAPNAGPLIQGWAEASLPPGVVGYAVFRQSVLGRADQEAVVPLTPESSQTADFAYDDTSSTTSVALVNPSNQQVTATITLYQSDGLLIGSSQLVLGARAKQAIALRNLPGLSGAAGKRGWATFSVPSGAISVLGLRFGAQAFTSIPVSHRTGAAGSTSVLALPQIAFGGGWYTALYFSNTTTSAVSLSVSFVAENGTPLSVPLLESGAVSSRIINLNPGATAVLEAPNTGDLVQGWGEVTLPPGVVGYAVFRQSVPGRADQEAVVPLSSESRQTADLVYDDTSLTTSTAFVNPSNQPITVAITVRDPNGSQIGSGQVILPARSKQAAVLKTLPGLAPASGQRGLAHFSVTSGAISVLGLRFGGEAFTSIPGSQ
jgi:hypothetical protein